MNCPAVDSRTDANEELAHLRARVAELEQIEAQLCGELNTLRESEVQFPRPYEQAPLAYQSLDAEGRILAVNQAWLDALGYAYEDVIGRPFADFLAGDGPEQFRANFLQFLAADHIDGIEYEMRRSDGGTLTCSFDGRISRDEAGRFLRTHCIMHDVTETRAIAQALQRERDRLAWAEALAGLGNWEWNSQADLVTWSRNMFALYEMPPTEESIIPRGVFHAMLHADDVERVYRAARDAMAGPGPVDVEYRVRTPAETRKHIWSQMQRFVDGQGAPLGLFGTDVDITQLRQAQEQYQTLFREMLDGFALHEIILDDEGRPTDYRFLAVNPAFERLTGLKAGDIIGKTVLEVLPGTEPHWIETYGRVALTGEPAFFESYAREQDKHWEVKAYRPAPHQFACIFIDITERKQAEEERLAFERQLLHTQKLESLGVLAGGVAHDFNNLLTTILGNTDMSMLKLPVGSPVRSYLSDVGTAARRAAGLAQQMLAYSGKGRFVVEALSLNEVIEEMTHLLEVSLSKKAALSYHLATNLPPIEADATQIRQVIMNLITNASEAIEESTGAISITTGAMECNREYLTTAYLDKDLKAGQYVYVEVADTGCGMTAQVQQRMFDPFFTTKFTGRGLGMAAMLGIVRGHQGAIKVSSEPGQGTTIKVLFPARADMHIRPANGVTATSDRWQGSGTILVVDDDETVLTLACRMVEFMGFDVLRAADGREALQVYLNHPGEIRGVVLDLTMPHMDGEETFRELRRIDPDVLVIMSSGYSEQDVTGRFAGKGLAGFIQKPYQLKSLEEKLREVLG